MSEQHDGSNYPTYQQIGGGSVHPDLDAVMADLAARPPEADPDLPGCLRVPVSLAGRGTLAVRMTPPPADAHSADRFMATDVLAETQRACVKRFGPGRLCRVGPLAFDWMAADAGADRPLTPAEVWAGGKARAGTADTRVGTWQFEFRFADEPEPLRVGGVTTAPPEAGLDPDGTTYLAHAGGGKSVVAAGWRSCHAAPEKAEGG